VCISYSLDTKELFFSYFAKIKWADTGKEMLGLEHHLEIILSQNLKRILTLSHVEEGEE
jgi:hypothetical protein